MLYNKNFVMPQFIFLTTSQDFVKFEEYLTSDWKWSFRVGGAVQREIERNDPQNNCFRILKDVVKREDVKHETPVRVNLHAEFIRTGQRTPAVPAPPPPKVMSNEALGRRWSSHP